MCVRYVNDTLQAWHMSVNSLFITIKLSFHYGNIFAIQKLKTLIQSSHFHKPQRQQHYDQNINIKVVIQTASSTEDKAANCSVLCKVCFLAYPNKHCGSGRYHSFDIYHSPTTSRIQGVGREIRV